MHYYKRNIGDYAKKAGRLSMLQHGSYTLLIDACYDRERFPTLDDAIEWTWASTESEIEAVKFVLSRFFKLAEDGTYVQDRILDEILEYHAKADTNKRIAIERETNRKVKGTNRERTVNEPPPNQEPLTKNQEPKEGGRRATRLPADFSPSPEPEAESGIDRQLELANFRDYWNSKARDNTKLDWQATWRQWARKADRPGVSKFAKPMPNITVPGSNIPDKELTRIEIERARAVPIPENVRFQLQKLKLGISA